MVRLEATFQNLQNFSFAILATIIGFISIGKQSKCGFTLYAVMSSICIIGKNFFKLDTFIIFLVIDKFSVSVVNSIVKKLIVWFPNLGTYGLNNNRL